MYYIFKSFSFSGLYPCEFLLTGSNYAHNRLISNNGSSLYMYMKPILSVDQSEAKST